MFPSYLQSHHHSFINLLLAFYLLHTLIANNNAINRLLRGHRRKHDLLSCPSTTGRLSLYCVSPFPHKTNQHPSATRSTTIHHPRQPLHNLGHSHGPARRQEDHPTTPRQ